PPLGTRTSAGTTGRAPSTSPSVGESPASASVRRSNRSIRATIRPRTAAKAELPSRTARSCACAAASVGKAERDSHLGGLAPGGENLRGAAGLGVVVRALHEHGRPQAVRRKGSG